MTGANLIEGLAHELIMLSVRVALLRFIVGFRGCWLLRDDEVAIHKRPGSKPGSVGKDKSDNVQRQALARENRKAENWKEFEIRMAWAGFGRDCLVKGVSNVDRRHGLHQNRFYLGSRSTSFENNPNRISISTLVSTIELQLVCDWFEPRRRTRSDQGTKEDFLIESLIADSEHAALGFFKFHSFSIRMMVTR
ncbi:hypothetical protein EI94DRAFT_1706023 [Lactarius quietus]|nr:hypothetical protein EI94DRAFT_1706023 [Lactarius quietus]